MVGPELDSRSLAIKRITAKNVQERLGATNATPVEAIITSISQSEENSRMITAIAEKLATAGDPSLREILEAIGNIAERQNNETAEVGLVSYVRDWTDIHQKIKGMLGSMEMRLPVLDAHSEDIYLKYTALKDLSEAIKSHLSALRLLPSGQAVQQVMTPAQAKQESISEEDFTYDVWRADRDNHDPLAKIVYELEKELNDGVADWSKLDNLTSSQIAENIADHVTEPLFTKLEASFKKGDTHEYSTKLIAALKKLNSRIKQLGVSSKESKKLEALHYTEVEEAIEPNLERLEKLEDAVEIFTENKNFEDWSSDIVKNSGLIDFKQKLSLLLDPSAIPINPAVAERKLEAMEYWVERAKDAADYQNLSDRQKQFITENYFGKQLYDARARIIDVLTHKNIATLKTLLNNILVLKATVTLDNRVVYKQEELLVAKKELLDKLERVKNTIANGKSLGSDVIKSELNNLESIIEVAKTFIESQEAAVIVENETVGWVLLMRDANHIVDNISSPQYRNLGKSTEPEEELEPPLDGEEAAPIGEAEKPFTRTGDRVLAILKLEKLYESMRDKTSSTSAFAQKAIRIYNDARATAGFIRENQVPQNDRYTTFVDSKNFEEFLSNIFTLDIQRTEGDRSALEFAMMEHLKRIKPQFEYFEIQKLINAGVSYKNAPEGEYTEAAELNSRDARGEKEKIYFKPDEPSFIESKKKSLEKWMDFCDMVDLYVILNLFNLDASCIDNVEGTVDENAILINLSRAGAIKFVHKFAELPVVGLVKLHTRTDLVTNEKRPIKRERVDLADFSYDKWKPTGGLTEADRPELGIIGEMIYAMFHEKRKAASETARAFYPSSDEDLEKPRLYSPLSGNDATGSTGSTSFDSLVEAVSKIDKMAIFDPDHFVDQVIANESENTRRKRAGQPLLSAKHRVKELGIKKKMAEYPKAAQDIFKLIAKNTAARLDLSTHAARFILTYLLGSFKMQGGESNPLTALPGSLAYKLGKNTELGVHAGLLTFVNIIHSKFFKWLQLTEPDQANQVLAIQKKIAHFELFENSAAFDIDHAREDHGGFHMPDSWAELINILDLQMQGRNKTLSAKYYINTLAALNDLISKAVDIHHSVGDFEKDSPEAIVNMVNAIMVPLNSSLAKALQYIGKYDAEGCTTPEEVKQKNFYNSTHQLALAAYQTVISSIMMAVPGFLSNKIEQYKFDGPFDIDKITSFMSVIGSFIPSPESSKLNQKYRTIMVTAANTIAQVMMSNKSVHFFYGDHILGVRDDPQNEKSVRRGGLLYKYYDPNSNRNIPRDIFFAAKRDPMMVRATYNNAVRYTRDFFAMDEEQQLATAGADPTIPFLVGPGWNASGGDLRDTDKK